MSPSARSLACLRQRGFIAATVERWIAQQGIRVDVWGFGDILAAHPVERVVMIVQATSLPNVAARLTKARSKPELAAWLRAGGAFEVHGWTRRNGRWEVKRVAVRVEDMAAVVLAAPRRRRRLRKGERQAGLFDHLATENQA